MNHLPATELKMISSPWPFAKWGLDIVGPLVPGQGDVKYVLVATYYFTQWAETKPFKTVTAEDVVNFMSLISFIGLRISSTLIMDNGRQFNGAAMRVL